AVAASFQTPTLFTLATYLTDMQVDTSVDEADVGDVRAGEAAQISVTAFPNVVFSGTVQQLRINPTIVQNVVTYDAVVIVHDSSGRLFPGMTGQVTIDVATRRHVLAVPTAALLFRPLPQRNAPSAPPGGGGLFGFGTPTNGTAPPAPVAAAPGGGERVADRGPEPDQGVRRGAGGGARAQGRRPSRPRRRVRRDHGPVGLREVHVHAPAGMPGPPDVRLLPARRGEGVAPLPRPARGGAKHAHRVRVPELQPALADVGAGERGTADAVRRRPAR